jgi:alpha-tubulin suppressor-like RCC1 family protein
MPHLGRVPSRSAPPSSGGQVHRRTRQLAPILALALVAALGCREDAESPTGPGPASVLDLTSTQVLSFRQISAGTLHTCGVTTDDRAYCWGYNVSGQLGDGTTADHPRPVAVAGGLRFVQVSAGAFYTCGVTTDSRAYCWGENVAGQLGNGTTAPHSTPVAVAGGRHFRQVRAGYFHTCAVNPFDLVFCWGYNSDGQLGDGTRTERLTPVRVHDGGLTFRQVFTAGLHTCGATRDNHAYCWGRNDDGQLGDGTTIRRLRPVAVVGGLNFRQAVVGAGRGNGLAWNAVSCGLTTDDRAYCWGDNRSGPLGDGTTTSRSRPVAVHGDLQFSIVGTGGVHTCGVTTGNLAYCWGSNGNAQLGDGTLTDRLTPVAVAGGLRFLGVTAGTFHTCGRTTDDRAYCWGRNDHGQLGNGTIDGNPHPVHWTPEPVVGPS